MQSDEISQERFIADAIRRVARPTVIAVNKLDVLSRAQTLKALEQAAELDLPGDVFPISARTGEGVPALLEQLFTLLPDGEFLYPPDEHTDLSASQPELSRTLRERLAAWVDYDQRHPVKE